MKYLFSCFFFQYSFDTVYVDKHDCGTLQENTAYLLIGKFLPQQVNPYLTNGFAHQYHLDESTFSFSGIRSDFRFLFSFFIGHPWRAAG